MPTRVLIAIVLLVAACSPTSTASPPAPSSSAPGITPAPTVRASTGSSPGATGAFSTPAQSAPPPASGQSPTNVQLSVEAFASGLPSLILLTHAGDGTGELYAVGQDGLVAAISADGTVQAGAPFLDIEARVQSGGEQGLLGLAFHPDYESNGRLFVNYTNNDGDSVTSEFLRMDSADGLFHADPDSERILFTIADPFGNHNGGMLAFGPDGYLYLSMGDGGGGGDTQGNAQALTTLLGKMIRIDVDSGDPYGIPADNPLIDTGLPEIWSYGLRNPWRFSFDRETGDMFIGDVGQSEVEEIDAEPVGEGGRNYGWNIMEGDRCFRTDPCNSTGLTMPVYVNDRSRGECAIIGGYVYRGTQYPQLTGSYVFSDSCSGDLWMLDARAAIEQGTAEGFLVGSLETGPSSFGEDEAGELYVVNLAGEIFRVVARTT